MPVAFSNLATLDPAAAALRRRQLLAQALAQPDQQQPEPPKPSPREAPIDLSQLLGQGIGDAGQLTAQALMSPQAGDAQPPWLLASASPTGPGPAPGNVPGKTGDGEPQVGAGPKAVQSWLDAHGQTLDASRLNWCGAYTNAALDQAGIPGMPGKSGWVATNWTKWGDPVDGAPQANDVLVMPRGRDVGQTGGHVGVATGEVRVNPKTGASEYQMKSGNAHHGIVSVDWVPSNQLVVRRAPQAEG